MKAVVAGATGLVGNELIKALIADPSFNKVIALSRRPLKMNHQKLVCVLFHNFSELAQLSPQLQGDVFFCCLGTTIRTAGSQESFKKVDLDGVIAFAQVAKQNSAKKFILVSALGASSQAKVFYNRVKGQAEDAVQEIFPTGSIIFRPGLLDGDREEFRLVENLALKLTRTLSIFTPDSFMNKIRTRVSDMVERMLQEAKNPQQEPCKIIPAADIKITRPLS